ncbi:hypothetical protein FH972_015671 [Carpinus fangiana]|uniref:Uncharacterized protein n=1 Tax=Carpinus fangiana TaxID=176857 RepID=A0A5N6RG74_9ROSI|nr:hypothetical protein FH972_015671 [Carpinus fangiana]
MGNCDCARKRWTREEKEGEEGGCSARSGSGSWSGDNQLAGRDWPPQPNLDATGRFGAEDGVDKRDVRDPEANSHLWQGDALRSAGLGGPQVPGDRFCHLFV